MTRKYKQSFVITISYELIATNNIMGGENSKEISGGSDTSTMGPETYIHHCNRSEETRRRCCAEDKCTKSINGINGINGEN